MPTTIIELPRSIEVKEVKYDEKAGTITIVHRFLHAQSTVTVAGLACKGAGGMESKALLCLSGRTGRYQISNLDQEATVKFDMEPEAFKKASDAKKATRSAAKPTPAETPAAVAPTAAAAKPEEPRQPFRRQS